MTTRDNRFLIITGLSGSGKSVALRALEDSGVFCVDNLPAKIIPFFVGLWRKGEVGLDRIALVADLREPGFLGHFPRVWQEIWKTSSARLIFLDASDETLLHRFSESRRPHPLGRRRSAREGIKAERRRLAPIKLLADEVIDTSGMTIAHLRDVFIRRFLEPRRRRLRLEIMTFGHKYGLPLDADLVFDTRFLPNPFYRQDLRDLPGTDRRVRAFVLGQAETSAFLAELVRFVRFLLPKFAEEGKSQAVIAVGCTGGRHRSVVVGEALADSLRRRKYDIKVTHRDARK
ncbi:MAG: RNase adapter RapZ [Candidatus Aminicenantes bacterium]|nr:RNase adapter RapZ [Candidatus Aminicenantes bacterium]